FDDGLVSGGDEDFCVRASRRGVALAYAPDARVAHAARATWGELVKKSLRIGIGTGQRCARGRFPLARLAPMLCPLLPRTRFLAPLVSARPKIARSALLGLFFLDWALKFGSAWGIARGLRARDATAPTRLRLALHGARVEVASDHAPFMRSMRSVFRDHADDGASPAHVTIAFGGSEPAWAACEKAGSDGETLGYRLALTRHAVVWKTPLEMPGLEMVARRDGDRLLVWGRHRDPHGPLGGLARRLLGLEKREVVLKNLAYFLVYFPLCWTLRRTRGLSLLHAAGASIEGKGVLLSGLGGSGKSTLSIAALGLAGSRLLSNNLVLHDARHAYALPEAIKLTEPSRRLSGEGAARLEAAGGSDFQERGSYLVRAAGATTRVRGARGFRLAYAERARVVPISREEAALRLRAGDDLSLETRHFRSFAAAMDLGLPAPGAVPAEDPLPALLEGASCFRLLVRKGDRPADVL